jgi:hypothetical protein
MPRESGVGVEVLVKDSVHRSHTFTQMPPLLKFAAVKPMPPPTFYDNALQYAQEVAMDATKLIKDVTSSIETCIPDMTDTKLLVTRRVIELKLNVATLIEGNEFRLLLSLSTLMAIGALLISVPRKNVQVAKTEKTSQSTEVVVPPADETESPIKMLPRDVFGRVIVGADSANASMRAVTKNDKPFKSYVKKQMVSQREEDFTITPIIMATPGSLDDETTTTSLKSKLSFKEFLQIPELQMKKAYISSIFSLSSTPKKPKS